jgi:hypothetical protein
MKGGEVMEPVELFVAGVACAIELLEIIKKK